jgi:hypothetical protein
MGLYVSIEGGTYLHTSYTSKMNMVVLDGMQLINEDCMYVRSLEFMEECRLTPWQGRNVLL